MINSRKAIWADNLHCAHVLKLPRVAIVFFVFFSVYVCLWQCQGEQGLFIFCIISVHGCQHYHTC